MPRPALCLALASLLALPAARATKGFPLPMMGFNTCNVGCGNYSFPNEAFVIKTAEAMVTLGLKDAGWGYVNLDDGWAAVQRNAAGQQVAVSRKFPSGMASVPPQQQQQQQQQQTIFLPISSCQSPPPPSSPQTPTSNQTCQLECFV